MNTAKSQSTAPAKGKGSATEGNSRRGPAYRPEPETHGTSDLFARVEVITEHSLGQRLLQLGAYLYCPGEFASFKDRLRHVIGREKLATAICGRDPTGKVERISAAFERVCFESLATKAAKAKREATG